MLVPEMVEPERHSPLAKDPAEKQLPMMMIMQENDDDVRDGAEGDGFGGQGGAKERQQYRTGQFNQEETKPDAVHEQPPDKQSREKHSLGSLKSQSRQQQRQRDSKDLQQLGLSIVQKENVLPDKPSLKASDSFVKK